MSSRPARRGAGQRLALLIGIDGYPRLDASARLRGAVNDAFGMAEILEDRFEFSHHDLLTLIDEQATRIGILRALDELAERAEPGDIVVIHYSGHGSQVWDAEGDEPDGLDETWVPFDGHRDQELERLDITDDEMFAHTARLRERGALVTLNMDCCHSGHAHRTTPGARRLKPDLRPFAPTSSNPRSAPARPALRGAEQTRLAEPSQVSFAACRDDQLALETVVDTGQITDPRDSLRFGAWTWSLLQVLQSLQAPATAREVFDRAARHLAILDPGQWPQIVGARDRLLFGVDILRPKRHILVTGLRDETVDLNAGAASSLAVGSRWGLFDPTVRDPHHAHPFAEAELIHVGPLTSRARLLGSTIVDAPRALEARAFELEPAAGESRLGVSIDPQHARAQEIRRAIEGSPVLYLTGDGDAEARLRVDGAIQDDKGRPIESAEQAQDVSTLIRRLEKRARFLHGLRLNQQDPQTHLADCLRLRFLGSPDPDGHRAEILSENGLVSFHEGDPLCLEIEQSSYRGLYIYLLDFGLQDDVSLIYPGEGGADLLDPDQPLRLGVLEGDRMELFLPTGFRGSEGLGFLKVFVTTRPTDFSWICTQHPWPSRSRRSHGLETLLSMGRRPSTFRVEEDWTANVVPFRLARRPRDRQSTKNRRQGTPSFHGISHAP